MKLTVALLVVSAFVAAALADYNLYYDESSDLGTAEHKLRSYGHYRYAPVHRRTYYPRKHYKGYRGRRYAVEEPAASETSYKKEEAVEATLDVQEAKEMAAIAVAEATEAAAAAEVAVAIAEEMIAQQEAAVETEKTDEKTAEEATEATATTTVKNYAKSVKKY